MLTLLIYLRTCFVCVEGSGHDIKSPIRLQSTSTSTVVRSTFVQILQPGVTVRGTRFLVALSKAPPFGHHNILPYEKGLDVQVHALCELSVR